MAMQFWAATQSKSHDIIANTGREPLGYAAGLMTWILAGSVIVAVKLVADEMPPWTMVCFRALISALVLLALSYRHLGEMAAFLKARWKEAFVVGAIGLGLTQGLFFSALHQTSAVNVGIVLGTAPMITMVFAHFILDEEMNRWQILGSAIAFCGIVVVSVKGSLANLTALQFGFGDLIALAGAFLFASYAVLLKRANFSLARIPLTTLLLFAGSLAALPFFLYEYFTGAHSNLKTNGYIALLYCSVIGGAAMYLLYNLSIELLGASKAGTMIYTQMLFVALFAWILLGEPIEPYHYAGASLVVIGILFVTLMHPKPKPTSG